jgi:hypothetical protein
MHLGLYVRRVSSLFGRLFMFLMVCAAIIAPTRGRAYQSDHVPEAVKRERVSALIRDTLSQGEHHLPNGITIWTRTNPSSTALEEVRAYGDSVIPILTDYLKSEDTRECAVAMRFLGALGGTKIVEPLRMVLLNHPSAGIRGLALYWLAAAPWEMAAPIIERTAESDVDPNVRDTAKDLIASHARIR